MADTSELDSNTNQIYRLFKEFRDESRAVTIASVSLVVSVLALLMAWMSANTSNRADAKVNYELREMEAKLKQMEEEFAVEEIRDAKIIGWLTAHGITIEGVNDE